MKLILVASDLSARSDRAVRRAIRLARAHAARCQVLHVVDEDLPADVAERYRSEAEGQLSRTVAALGDDVDVVSQVLLGDPVRTIAEEATTRGADLVVFGTHRARTFLDFLRETTVERMVRLVSQPALVVRDPAQRDYSSVLVPVSFSPACAKALGVARKLLPEARISAFHAVHLPFAGLTREEPGGQMDRELTAEAEELHARWCAAEGLADDLCEVTTITGSLSQVLGQRMEAEQPQLIALGAHARGRLAPHMLGSFTADLLRDPPVDLLIAAV